MSKHTSDKSGESKKGNKNDSKAPAAEPADTKTAEPTDPKAAKPAASGKADEAKASASEATPEAKADVVAPTPVAPSGDEREPLPHPSSVDTTGDPQSAAPAPGRAPRGDSRSMRKGSKFCLVYRHKEFLVKREGTVGKLGTWTVTEYPSMSSAAHAYAQECSDLSGAGFTDVRG